MDWLPPTFTHHSENTLFSIKSTISFKSPCVALLVPWPCLIGIFRCHHRKLTRWHSQAFSVVCQATTFLGSAYPYQIRFLFRKRQDSALICDFVSTYTLARVVLWRGANGSHQMPLISPRYPLAWYIACFPTRPKGCILGAMMFVFTEVYNVQMG